MPIFYGDFNLDRGSMIQSSACVLVMLFVLIQGQSPSVEIIKMKIQQNKTQESWYTCLLIGSEKKNKVKMICKKSG